MCKSHDRGPTDTDAAAADGRGVERGETRVETGEDNAAGCVGGGDPAWAGTCWARVLGRGVSLLVELTGEARVSA